MDNDLEIKFARLEERSEHIIKKLDNTRQDISKMFDKLDSLPCNSHREKIRSNTSNVARLYTIIIAVIIGGIVLGLWIK